ncbi:hypothetical protein [Microbulbifer okhotskensis]|uniref:hypothetical protein n=1 Tax=Microbulbifer okhotskensis TaxID=2926617 RepID=UPI00207D327D|nr:hypothetical protein [Microbulbifer okhotskensis]
MSQLSYSDFISVDSERASKSRRWRDLRKNGPFEGNFTVSNVTATLLGGASVSSGTLPALLLSEDDKPRIQGVLTIKYKTSGRSARFFYFSTQDLKLGGWIFCFRLKIFST